MDCPCMVENPIVRALNTLQCAIVHSRAVDVLGSLRPQSNAVRPELPAVLQVFADLWAEQAQFGKAERAVLEATQLQILLETAWWARLVTALTRRIMSEDMAADLTGLCARLELVASGLPALAALLDVSDLAIKPTPAGLLVVSVTGLVGQPPSLTQIASAIEAVNQLWVVAEILAGQSGTFHLVATEPGPEMTLHFNGEAEPLEELRALLVSVQEQTGRLPNASVEQQAALVPPMLPVLDRIGRSGRSDALRVRSAVESGVRHFLQAGCNLRPEHGVRPEEEPRSEPEPEQHAEPGRLAVSAASNDYDASHLARLIAEERRQLEGGGRMVAPFLAR